MGTDRDGGLPTPHEPAVSGRLIAKNLDRIRHRFGDELVDDTLAEVGLDKGALSDPALTLNPQQYERLVRSLLDGLLQEIERRGRKIEETREHLVQSERLAAMGRLVTGVAHEINNPLTGIRADAEVLQARDGDPELAAIGRAIAIQVDRCSRLIHNMLAFGRQQPAQRVPFELSQVVDRAMGLHAYSIKMDRLELERPASVGGPTVMGDPGQLQQVVHNLVENALWALRQADGPRHLAVRILEEPDGVVLEVEDNGPGIPVEDRERVLEPFFSTRSAGEGTGLGLSICHGIVHSHGGRLVIQDPPAGGGTLVRIALPAARGAAIPWEGPGEPSNAPPTGPAAAPEPPRVKATHPEGAEPTYRLLVVEDEVPILDAIVRLLRDFGHGVTRAASAEEARGALADAGDAFDAILVDLKMPGETGAAFYAGLPAHLQSRVVFMTGALAFRSHDGFLSHFWGRYVEKPFTYRELLRVLRRVMPPDGTPTPP